MIKFGSIGKIRETRVILVFHGISINFKIIMWMFNIYLSGKSFCLASMINCIDTKMWDFMCKSEVNFIISSKLECQSNILIHRE